MAKKPAKKMMKGKAAKPAAKPTSVTKPFTKSQIVGYIAQVAAVKKAEAAAALSGLYELIEMHMKKKGPGEFVLPGLAKIRRIHKPATKARQGINPFTGEQTTFAAKPARHIVKVRPLQKLKTMVTM